MYKILAWYLNIVETKDVIHVLDANLMDLILFNRERDVLDANLMDLILFNLWND